MSKFVAYLEPTSNVFARIALGVLNAGGVRDCDYERMNDKPLEHGKYIVVTSNKRAYMEMTPAPAIPIIKIVSMDDALNLTFEDIVEKAEELQPVRFEDIQIGERFSFHRKADYLRMKVSDSASVLYEIKGTPQNPPTMSSHENADLVYPVQS